MSEEPRLGWSAFGRPASRMCSNQKGGSELGNHADEGNYKRCGTAWNEVGVRAMLGESRQESLDIAGRSNDGDGHPEYEWAQPVVTPGRVEHPIPRTAGKASQ